MNRVSTPTDCPDTGLTPQQKRQGEVDLIEGLADLATNTRQRLAVFEALPEDELTRPIRRNMTALAWALEDLTDALNERAQELKVQPRKSRGRPAALHLLERPNA